MGIVSEERSKVKVGQRFNRMTVIGACFTIEHKKCRHYVICECDCGEVKSVQVTALIYGTTRSCGCLHEEAFVTHGLSRRGKENRLHKIWKSMHARCEQPSNKFYDRYGGRGIAVCGEWSEFEPFRKWAIGNGYSDELTIDRIENDGGYEPCNCRWATKSRQARNRSSTVFVTAFGETKSSIDWAEDSRCVVSAVALRKRIQRGIPHEQAITCGPRKVAYSTKGS